MLTQEQFVARIKMGGKSFLDVEIGDLALQGFSSEYDNINFEGALFKGEVNFSNAKFNNVSFRRAHFFKKTTFDGAQFKGDADFAYTTFYDDVTFNASKEQKTEFTKHVTFGVATFKRKVAFNDCRFNGEAYLSYANYSEADFNYARFAERTFFEGKADAKLFSDKFPTSFVSVLFLKPEEVRFESVNLTKCILRNSDLSKVELTDIEWGEKRDLFSKRKALYDELIDGRDSFYPLIEKVYRQLKKNYETRGSYGEAGDFHYGEMEMQRLAHKGLQKYISLTSIYRYLSGYGEKYWLAFFWLGIFLILFSSLYLLTGLRLQSVDPRPETMINYNLTFAPELLFSPLFWKDFSASILHTFEVATFQRNKTFISQSMSGKFLEILQTILISTQVALLALAIRRKFKR